jgi:hypothetical protein
MRVMQAKAQDKKESLMFTRVACVMVAAAVLAGCETGSDPYRRPTPRMAVEKGKSTEMTPDWMQVRDYSDGGPIPPMVEGRKINEQSCSEGVALTAGNLKCK